MSDVQQTTEAAPLKTVDIRLLKRATAWLMEDDPEFVEGGCADVCLLLTFFAHRHRMAVKLVAGHAIFRDEAEPTNHVWLNVGGKVFDPTYSIQGIRPKAYVPQRMVIADTFGVSREDVEWRLDDLMAAVKPLGRERAVALLGADKVEPRLGERVLFLPYFAQHPVTAGKFSGRVDRRADEAGWDILRAIPGDPGRIMRVWSHQGVFVPAEGIERMSPEEYLSGRKEVRTFALFREVRRGSHYDPDGWASLSLANAKPGDSYQFSAAGWSGEWTVKKVTAKTIIFASPGGKAFVYRGDSRVEQSVRRDIGGWLLMQRNSHPKFHHVTEAVKNLLADPMYQHAQAVEQAMAHGLPVSAKAVDDYDLVIPPGCERMGACYQRAMPVTVQAAGAADHYLPASENAIASSEQSSLTSYQP